MRFPAAIERYSRVQDLFPSQLLSWANDTGEGLSDTRERPTWSREAVTACYPLFAAVIPATPI